MNSVTQKQIKLLCGEYRITVHAESRLRQRGLSRWDLELILTHGEAISDGYVMSRIAIDNRTAELKSELARIERLRDVTVIEDSGDVITLYRADKRRLRKLRNRH